MAFTELETARNLAAIKWFLDRRRPPEQIRPKLDIACKLEGQVVDVFEIRPDWQDKTIIRHSPVARLRYVRTENVWRLYWMRSDLKWHAYQPAAVHKSLRAALEEVNADPCCCFFG